MWISSVVNIDWPSRTGLTAEAQQAEFLHWRSSASTPSVRAADGRRVLGRARSSRGRSTSQACRAATRATTRSRSSSSRRTAATSSCTPGSTRTGSRMQADPAQARARAPGEGAPRVGLGLRGQAATSTPGCPRRRSTSTGRSCMRWSTTTSTACTSTTTSIPTRSAGRRSRMPRPSLRTEPGCDTVEAWRRHNVDTFVRTVSERIKAAKPWVKFGISPFGIWRNAHHRPPPAPTTGGSQSYDLQFADTRRWVLEGWLDYINPQIYWQFGLAVADYAKLVPWWADVAAASGTHLYIGEALYKVTSGVFTDPAELARTTSPSTAGSTRRRHARARQRVLLGEARAALEGVDVPGARAALHAHPAIVPAMPSLPNRPRCARRCSRAAVARVGGRRARRRGSMRSGR